jgi:hypothetical protein
MRRYSDLSLPRHNPWIPQLGVYTSVNTDKDGDNCIAITLLESKPRN